MIFKIQNIEIPICGIAVFTGENSSGKSIILRELYTIIKNGCPETAPLKDVTYVESSLLLTLSEVILSAPEKFPHHMVDFAKKTASLRFPSDAAADPEAFGLLHALLDAGTVGEDRLLIWEEPENHLHPKWQIEFTTELVGLAKRGVPVVISTKSPYILQGIRYHAAALKTENNIRYYLTERKNGAFVAGDITHDLNRAFTGLASPLNEIMNLNN